MTTLRDGVMAIMFVVGIAVGLALLFYLVREPRR
jgi:hypothetical protein